MFILFFVLNMVVSVLMRIYISKGSYSNEKKIRKLRVFLRFKWILYIPCLAFLGLQISEYRIRSLMILIPVCILLLEIVDAVVFYSLSKKLREADVGFGEYMRLVIIDGLMVLLPIIIIFVIKILFEGAASVGLYLFYGIFLIYNLILPYLYKFRFKGCTRLDVGKIDTIDFDRYRIFTYDGKGIKEANAITCGIIPPYHIYISDYMMDNFTRDEIKAVLLHEVCHLKKHHLWIRNIYLVGIYPLITGITYAFDTYFPDINIPLGIAIILSVLIIYGIILFLFISRKQELAADKFAVVVMRDKDTYISMLEKLRALNMMNNKTPKGEELLSTHPSFERRKEAVSNITL